MKEEVVRLGVELSLSIAESMFLLSDDIYTLLWFCYKLWRGVIPYRNPVLERVLCVIYYIYSKHIKPKNGVYQDGGKSVQWEFIRNTWKDVSDGIIVLHRLDMLLRRKDSSFDDTFLSSAFEKYKQQVLKMLEDKLSPAKQVSQAHGFARETLESNIVDFWKSLFYEKPLSKVVRSRILSNLFTPILGKLVHSEMQALPISSPYILGKDFAMQELKEEVVRLGVELSLFIAESMFLLCDDIRIMLWFCYRLCRDAKRDVTGDSPVVERLLRVIHYAYTKDIKPKNGVYQDGGNSVQWELVKNTWKDFLDGIVILDRLDMVLRRKDSSFDDRLLSSAIKNYKQDVLKKLEDKLRSAEDVSEAHGFVRETLVSNIVDLWKSLFDEEVTPKVVRSRILSDLFTPIWGKPVHSEIQALPIFSPYILGKDFAIKEPNEEVVRLGVELSLFIAKSMFLLCDDIHTLLWFCYKLWRGVIPAWNPVLERVLCVIYYIYSKHIKPKKGVYQDGGKSVQWELIRNTWKDFADGIIVLHRLDMVLRRKDSSFDNRLLLSAIKKYKQDVLKKLEDNLRPAEEVSEEHGYARETLESDILDLWRSLFYEKALSNVVRSRILSNLFTPILGKPVHREMQALPVSSPYILGNDFAMQELKEEVVRLGVELSLFIAESMFLLCDDIRIMLRFCYRIWSDAKRDVIGDSPVVERLLCVIYYVYTKDIKPKKGVYQNGGNNSAHWELIRTTSENFVAGFRDLDRLVLFLRGGGICGREFMSSIEEEVKEVGEKLWFVKAVSEANGFGRDVMKSNCLDVWKSLFDKEAKEATLTLKAIKNGILLDLFLPLYNEAPPP
ncbi:hypothetical protein CARUB_v10022638mg [Capsella rubella]|uniref:Uncharacterized protein n=2 Tax=Capsella rubella TaxID=81985 RepID=R0HB11_9BRAS|nr:hypothetical protein CARUB_v10022638mg [Capsella rubella]